ncbi:MAG: sugar phosphate nucleotidyltransferase [Actinomycetota bacterium]
MKAVVLVGGEGTRMRPLTETIPKPLLPFMNRPFLAHVLDHLARHGVDEVVCSSPYLESVFHEFLESRRDLAPRVRWVTEEKPLGTAGAIAGARELLDDTFFALNGDVLTDLDLGALASLHRERGAVATIALTRVEDSRPFGLVETDDDGRVLAFREKPEELVPGTINAGTYVLEPSVLDRIPAGEMVSIERETYPGLISEGAPVFGYTASGYWRDLGTPQAYLAAHLDALNGLIEGYRDLSGPLIAARAAINPGATVATGVVIGMGAEVASGAVLDRSVLHAGCRVGTLARVRDSVLGPGSSVGERAELTGVVLGEGASVADGVRSDGALIGPGERLEAAPARG